MWNYNATIEDVFEPIAKKKNHNSNLQNNVKKSTIYNCPHTLVCIWGRFFLKNMIHIPHPMCLAMFPLLHSTHVNGHKFGDTQIEDELKLPQTCPYCKVYIKTTHIKHEPYKKP
jgi:hypothetical protein